MVQQPAGFWIRFAASILDSIFIAIFFTFIFGYIIGIGDLSQILDVLYLIIVPVVWYGYTIGKRICGIRIVKMNGENVGIGTMLLRQLVGGIIYAITLGIAIIVSITMVAVREDKRSVHDFIAGTYVTYDDP
ncbi:RDD family protein [Chengkuizengella sediminis]|uniref:RDD family protein n=1 Tax=Chengkuizengella sediminis TaxID=1885917 RepID=UPI00138A4800|nr:RDD family protein [Chengkuizengella sediminis]NDI36382.1 RDD family protein [Chengkuizengella sediminis]